MCGYTLCRNCEDYVKEDNHECYIQPKVTKACPENYMFVDYEAEQDAGVHIPNLIIAHYFDGTNFYFRTNDEFCK